MKNNKTTLFVIILNCVAYVSTAMAAILQLISHNPIGIFFTVLLITLSVLNFVLGVLNFCNLRKNRSE